MYERKNYIAAIAALVVTLASAVLAYVAIQASWEIAELSGSLDKAELEVGIDGHPLVLGRTNHVVVGAADLSTGNIPSIGVLPFSFSSKGKKSLDSVLISFQYHAIFRRDILEHGSMKSEGAFATTELRKNAVETGDRFFVNYVLPTLNPGVTADIQEPIFLSETRIRSEVPITTKDGVKMTGRIEMQYSVNFGLAVSARDTQVQGYSVSLAIAKVTSLQQLLTSDQVQKHISRRQDELRTDLGLLSYLAALITSSPTEAVFVVFLPQKKVAAGETSLFAPADKPAVGRVTYPLLSWALLLGERK